MDITSCSVNIPDEYKVVCLCGSTKFKKSFEKINAILTLNSKVVLGPAVWAHSDKIEISGNQKFELDKLHKQKIYMSDCIFVVNENNYWGDSTKGEIQYATSLNKPVFYCFAFDGIHNHYNDIIFTRQPTIFERWGTDEKTHW